MFAERFATFTMSADLTRDDGTVFQVTSAVWSFVLRIAEEYGWSPSGTLPPDGGSQGPWGGSYDSSDGQRVTAEDARHLAEALERAAKDPEREKVERRVNDELASAVREQALRDYGIELPPDDDDYVTAAPAYLAELGAFLRVAGFRVA